MLLGRLRWCRTRWSRPALTKLYLLTQVVQLVFRPVKGYSTGTNYGSQLPIEQLDPRLPESIRSYPLVGKVGPGLNITTQVVSCYGIETNTNYGSPFRRRPHT